MPSPDKGKRRGSKGIASQFVNLVLQVIVTEIILFSAFGALSWYYLTNSSIDELKKKLTQVPVRVMDGMQLHGASRNDEAFELLLYELIRGNQLETAFFVGSIEDIGRIIPEHVAEQCPQLKAELFCVNQDLSRIVGLTPISLDRARNGYIVQVVKNDVVDYSHDFVLFIRFVIAILGGFSVNIIAVLFFFRRKILREFRGLHQLLQGFQSRVPGILSFVFRIEEFQRVGTALHEAVEIRTKAEAMEKEAAIGRVIANLSHDLRTPLGTIESILHLPSGTDFAQEKPAIKSALNRINAMIEAFRYTDVELIISPYEARFNLSECLEPMRLRAKEKGISLQIISGARDTARIDHFKFERALVNLVSNAVEIANEDVRVVLQSEKSHLFLQVIDDGPGVPQDLMLNLFQRGATFGKVGGTGLGLAYVKQIMEGHGGSVGYCRKDGLTFFECRIPNAFATSDGQPHIEAEPIMPNQNLQDASQPHRIAICFHDHLLSAQVVRMLEGLQRNAFAFTAGFDEDCSTILTNLDSIADRAYVLGKKVICFAEDSTPEEIIRRSPGRLGIKV